MSKRSSPAGYTPAVDVGPLCAALRQMLRGSARSLGQWRVPIFERKFGTDFLATVPREPGIYRMYDAAGGLFYVGKARNLRRRLAQYRAARRTKKDRKRRTLVRSADRIEWQVCASLFSDQSAWARGRCRDTADRAGDPPERRRLAEEPHEERDSNCHLSRLLDGRKPLG
jgi:GIY-YIG catalytic domain-containing protein